MPLQEYMISYSERVIIWLVSTKGLLPAHKIESGPPIEASKTPTNQLLSTTKIVVLPIIWGLPRLAVWTSLAPCLLVWVKVV